MWSGAQCPVITTQPVDVATCSGETVTFSIEATGNIASYQWFRLNVPMPGTNSPQLVIPNATSADNDWYRCEVYPPDETCDIITSGSVSLSVADHTAITMAPSGGSICEGGSFVLSVAATGTSLQYQWYRDSDPIPDAVGENYEIANATPDDGATYYCQVSSPYCPSVASTEAAVIVVAATTIVQHPQGGDYCLDDPIYMTVGAQGSDLTYLWYKDDQEIPGSIEPYFYSNTAYPSDAGTYTCVVTGSCGVATSNPAVVTVDCLGTADVEAGRALVWPIPAADILNVDFKDGYGATDIDLIDIRGRRCARWQVQGDAVLDVSGIAPGTYALRISGHDQYEMRRIVIE